MCLYCGGINHRAAERTARKNAQMIKAVGAKVKGVETRTGSDESGKDKINWRRIAFQLTIKVLFQML